MKLKQQQTIMTTTNQKDENYINDYVMYQDGYLIHGKVKFIRVENQTNTTIINSNLPQLKSQSPHFLENDKIYVEFKPLARKRLDDEIADNSVAMLHKVRERIDADTNSLYDEFGKVKDKGRSK
jgi:hypothetical protein